MADRTDKAPARSGTVYVGCRLPHGLVLQLTEPHEGYENVMGGGSRKFMIHRRTGESIKLHGIVVAPGQTPKWPIVNGAAITKVPADFWEKWLEQNKSLDVVKNRLVFAQATMDSARSEARELRKERTGMEPINPDKKAKDPRMKGIKSVEKNDNPEDEDYEMEA